MNALVLLKVDNLPPLKWRLSSIINVGRTYLHWQLAVPNGSARVARLYAEVAQQMEQSRSSLADGRNASLQMLINR
ncbi:hypothetical protein EVAR_100510_1 [Eumeta japonica]|uniref:Uncharacterized protein n=1 Tax=Eumeta variegata TaxID=151549 RepID=A0A4C2A8X8_EUMVA|nr:hypothetical protein EVAR_100510_1 [Eumeta japonica]